MARRPKPLDPVVLTLGGVGVLAVAALLWPRSRQAIQQSVESLTTWTIPREEGPVTRDPTAFTPTSSQRVAYATPSEARAALGELSQYFAWSEPGVWPKNGAPVPHDVAMNMLTFARTWLDPLRVKVGPIQVTSWYRPPDYNASVEGASSTSMHPTGWAADIIVRNGPNGYKGAMKVADVFASYNLPWDQIIGYEDGTPRMHVGAKYHDGRYRMLVQEFRPGASGSSYPVVARWQSSGSTITRVA